MKKIIITAAICLYFCGVVTLALTEGRSIPAAIFLVMFIVLFFWCVRIEIKRKRRVYISAPISGYDYEERKAFFKKKEELIKTSSLYEPVNPLKNGLPVTASVEEHLKADLKMLLDCDEMWLYGDITKSAGCRLEYHVAKMCGIRINDYSFMDNK